MLSFSDGKGTDWGWGIHMEGTVGWVIIPTHFLEEHQDGENCCTFPLLISDPSLFFLGLSALHSQIPHVRYMYWMASYVPTGGIAGAK